VLNQVVSRLRDLDATIRDLTARLEGEGDVSYQLETPEPTWRITVALAALLVVVGLGLAVGGAVVLSGAMILLPVGIGLAIVGLVLGILAGRQRSIARDLRRQKEMAGAEIDRRLRGRSQMEQELKQAQIESVGQLETLGLEDLAAAEALLTAEREHVSRIETLTAGLEGLVGRQPPETLPQLRDAAALEIAQKNGALEQLGPIAREPRARERLETDVRDGASALERARDDEAGARARVEANAVDAEQVAGETERLAAWREQLAALERRSRVYAATLAAIEGAEQTTMRTATRFLEKRMVIDIARITADRYRRVRVDDRSLAIEVFAPEKGDWVDVSALSQGTLDQVYLAARLGLVRLVTGDRRPPLIFDDPFVTFDDDRAARALDMLHELIGDFQVIYLTTSERYDAAADRVVVLAGPTAADSGAGSTGPADSAGADA
jgi:DNA repair exonuclease SbcCD ATPase subunit